MLHTLSHQWPTPSQAVIINPDTGLPIGRTEVERRSKYFERIDRSRSDVLIPLIESCLSNLPKNRPSIVRVCDQLEGQVVDRESVSTNELTMSALQQEIQQKDSEIQRKDNEIHRKVIKIQKRDTEIQRKDDEIQSKSLEIQRNIVEIQYLSTALHDKDVMLETLRSDMSKLQVTTPLLPNKVNKSSSDFWNSLKLTWQQCADLPCQCWASSVAELDGKVYISMLSSGGGYVDSLMYDFSKDQWSRSALPALPYSYFSLVTVPDRKQLLAVGGTMKNNGVDKFSNKVFLWDEDNKKWTTPYPNMPTARCDCSSISYRSTVIVAGGVTCYSPLIVTRAVEVLHIKEHGLFNKSHWSVVEQLPLVVHEAIPLIVNGTLYLSHGYGSRSRSTCNVVTASLPQLLQSSNKNTSSGQVWDKLPDMPYSSPSINCYQGRLITFSGDYKVECPNGNKSVYKIVPFIHIYNPDTESWDCVGEIPHAYMLGKSLYLKGNRLLFVGGITGTLDVSNNDMLTTCSILTLLP